MSAKRHAVSACPGCGKMLDASTHSEGGHRSPKPGDVSVCAYCGEILVFGGGLEVHAATLQELAEIPLEIHLKVDRIRAAIKARDRAKKGQVDVMVIDTPKAANEIPGACDRCGRTMNVFPEIDTHGAIRIDTCGPCRAPAQDPREAWRPDRVAEELGSGEKGGRAPSISVSRPLLVNTEGLA